MAGWCCRLASGLNVPSSVRVHKLTVLPKSDVVRNLGSCSDSDREALLKLVQKQGVNRKQFEQALDSPEVNARLQQSQRFSAASGAKGVPALVVEGKYQTSLTQAGTPEQLFVTLNELISQAMHSKKPR